MIINFGYGYNYDNGCGLCYKEGKKLIKKAVDAVKGKKLVDMAVLDGLSSLKDFWDSNVFFSEVYYWPIVSHSEPLTILEEGLRYFCDKRRNLKFSDCEEKIQKLFDDLKRYVVGEKEAEAINEINQTEEQMEGLLGYSNDLMAPQDFLKYADCVIKKSELLDRYTNKDYKKAVSRQRFIKDTVQKLGMSDSYMAQIMYRKLADNLSRSSCSEDLILNTALNLETYRCIIGESEASEKEILMKYRPCVS